MRSFSKTLSNKSESGKVIHSKNLTKKIFSHVGAKISGLYLRKLAKRDLQKKKS